MIDGSGSKDFRRQLEKYLKDRINQHKAGFPYIKKIKIQDSKKNNLLQVADMVAGSVARFYKTEKKDCKIYREIIRHRENFGQNKKPKS